MKRPQLKPFSEVASQIGRGSNLIWERRSEALAEWVRQGRRDDLDGWRAALGPAFRLVILGAAAYGAWAVVRAWPKLLWVVTAGWLIASWRAGRAVPDEAAEEEAERPPLTIDPAAVRRLLADLIGDRPGVHLSTVLTHLRERGLGEGWEVPDLRSRLEAHGVPVRRSVKVDRRVAYGVHRDDLPAPTETPSPAEPSDQAA